MKDLKILSRKSGEDSIIVDVNGLKIGGNNIVVIAGPCSIESIDQALEIAKVVKSFGAAIFRGGAFKPRTSPYSFQGLGVEGLKILSRVRDETGLPVVTEVMDTRDIDVVLKYSDILQVGARNMQNFPLLKELGKIRAPVVLKRGFMSTIEEWLLAAEYIALGGNTNIILCERGIRTFEKMTRNTLDLSCIPIVKQLCRLPVITDPSHATGIREIVKPMALASIAAGADGIMVEVHNDPDKALSDGFQSLTFSGFKDLMDGVVRISKAIGRGTAGCLS